MQLNKIIIHKIDKQPNQDQTQTIYSNNLLPITNQTVIDFANALSKAYFHKKSRFYTQFKIDENEPIFKTRLDEYMENHDNYIQFSRSITNLLKNEMERKPQSKGGFLVIMDYVSTSGNNYLFLALLDNKLDFSIEDNTFEIIRQMTLNIEHMAMASVINLTKYQDKKPDYITFLKGLREVPDYFVDFIGADRDRRRDLRELTKKWVDAIEDFFAYKGIEDTTVDNLAADLISRVKVLNRDENVITSEIIANIIYPENPNEFLDFIYDEERDYTLPNEFEKLDTSSLNNLRIISYSNRNKSFSIKFRKRDFDSVVKIENNRIIIDDPEIATEIHNIIRQNNEYR